MKFRPSSTTSERQLCLALAATGRVISLSDLTNWRKYGLLPPFSTSGSPTGRGRTYYWREENIFAQAVLVWDCMRRHGRRDRTALTLFLSGFPVPLQKVRRIAIQRSKLRKELRLHTASPEAFRDLANVVPGLSSLLMRALDCIGDSLGDSLNDRSVVTPLIQTLATLSNSYSDFDIRSARRLWYLGTVVSSALENSNLLLEVSDEEMRVARYYVSVSTEFLRRGSNQELPGEVIETVGPLLFTLVLALVRAGFRGIFDDIFAQVQYANPGHSCPTDAPRMHNIGPLP